MPNPAPQDHVIDIRQYVRIVWRRKGLVVLCSVLAVCSAFVALRFVPEVYVSTVSIQIQDRQPLSSGLEQVMGGMGQPVRERGIEEKRLGQMVARIRSRPFLERVVRLLQMDKDPIVRQLAAAQQKDLPEMSLDELAVRIIVKNLQSRITFSSGGAGVYQIRVADYSAANAQMLAQWVSELYVDTSVQSSLNYLRAAHEFGQEQLRIYEKQLRDAEDALARYRGDSIGERLDSSIVSGGNLGLAEALRQKIQDEVAMGRARTRPIEEAVREAGLAGEETKRLGLNESDELIEGLRNALRDEVRQILSTDGAKGWPPSGPYDVRRRELFRELARRADVQFPEVSGDARSALARYVFSVIDTQAHQDAEEMLGRAVRAFKQQAQAQPQDEITLSALVADVERARELLDQFRSQLVASDVSEAMETTKLGLQVEVLDPAQLPLYPTEPDRKRILMAALFLGPVIGVGFTVLGEMMDSTLRSLDDFKRLFPEPVLGTIPYQSGKVRRPGKVRRYWVPATVSAVVVLTAALLLAGDSIVGRFLKDTEPVTAIQPEVTP